MMIKNLLKEKCKIYINETLDYEMSADRVDEFIKERRLEYMNMESKRKNIIKFNYDTV